jgi:hypothetical protein
MLSSFILAASSRKAAGGSPPFAKNRAFFAQRKTLRPLPSLGSVHFVPGKRVDVTEDVAHRRGYNDERASRRANRQGQALLYLD